MIVCQECLKPRCVYALRKLNDTETAVVDDIDDSRLYTCGSSLFPSSSCYYDSVAVRQSLSCADPVEVQYYSATLVSFPNVCFYCGASEETLIEDEYVRNLRKEYAIVRPICFLRRSSGKACH